MKQLHKKTGRLSVLAILATVLLLCLLWPVIRSATSVKYLEEGLYSMGYSGDYGLEDFLDQGGRDSDMAVADFVIDRLVSRTGESESSRRFFWVQHPVRVQPGGRAALWPEF